MNRSMKLLLCAGVIGAAFAQPAVAQGDCGTCWEAVSGASRVHAFGVSAPTPPSGYSIDVSDEYFYEVTGGGEHAIADQGHTYWLSGSCASAHGICEPVDFAAAISRETAESLARWIVNTPGVRVGDVSGTVEVECSGEMVTRAVPHAVWIIAGATQSLVDMGFPVD